MHCRESKGGPGGKLLLTVVSSSAISSFCSVDVPLASLEEDDSTKSSVTFNSRRVRNSDWLIKYRGDGDGGNVGNGGDVGGNVDDDDSNV